LRNKNVLLGTPLSCFVCKMIKSKTLPFPTSAHHALK